MLAGVFQPRLDSTPYRVGRPVSAKAFGDTLQKMAYFSQGSERIHYRNGRHVSAEAGFRMHYAE